jgi:hypothetical protein
MKILTKEEKKDLIEKAAQNIRDGILVSMTSGSYDACSLCIGDFSQFGWVQKVYSRHGYYYTWLGPNPVKVDGKILEYKQRTSHILMDWI